MCVIEAGSEGVPVISTRVGALPKLFEKQIAFVSSDGRGKPNVMELRNHLQKQNLISKLINLPIFILIHLQLLNLLIQKLNT